MLCSYRNIFGEERKGFHSFRLFDIAIGDMLFTIISASIIAYFSKIHFVIVMSCLMIIGILIHRIFCVNTKINKVIFGEV